MNEFDAPEPDASHEETPWALPSDSQSAAWEAPTEQAQAGPDANDMDGFPVETAPAKDLTRSHSVRRALVFAGAATAAGLFIGTGYAVANGGSHRASKPDVVPTADQSTVDTTVTASPTAGDPSGSTSDDGTSTATDDGTGAPEGRFGPGPDREGDDGDFGRGDFRGPDDGQQGIGAQPANPPAGAQPSGGASSSSHGS